MDCLCVHNNRTLVVKTIMPKTASILGLNKGLAYHPLIFEGSARVAAALSHNSILNPIFFSIYDINTNLEAQFGQFIDLSPLNKDKLNTLYNSRDFKTSDLDILGIKDSYIDLFLNKNLTPKVRSFLQLSLIEEHTTTEQFNDYWLPDLHEFSCNPDNYMSARKIARDLAIK